MAWPHTIPQRGRKTQEPVAINLKLDTALTVSSCARIVEDLMKYILYQRCQIPVPFDAVVREARLQRQAHHGDNQDTPPPQDQVSRKKEIMKQKLHRKRQQWLNKVEKFLQNFNSMKESLRNELKSGHVQGVGIILGSSVMTGRESYFIRLPEGYSSQSNAQLPEAHHTGVKLFKTLVTNEALLKVMNRPCGVQRIWVMLQKSSSPPPDNTPVLEGDITSASLIPRPEYSQNPRTTMVEINIQHTCVNAPMDLTPTVGSGITLHNLRIKKSLYLSSPSASHFYSHNINQDTGVHDSDKKKMLPPSLSGNLQSTYNRPILETPVKIFKGDVVPVVETPIHSSVHKIEAFTPSKQLASQLGTFNLSDGALNTVWYQIDCLISGFRDICTRS